MSKQPKKEAVSDFDFESYRQTVILGLMQGTEPPPQPEKKEFYRYCV
jgi:hypothetical protein